MITSKESQITNLTSSNNIHTISGFTKQMRGVDNMSFEKGDEFTIPENPQVYSMTLGSGNAEFIVVETQSGICKRFFPSVFYKRGMEVDKDGMLTGNIIYSTGKVCEDARSHQTVAEAMAALANKRVKVTDLVYRRISSRFQERGFIDTGFPTLDYVEQPAEQSAEPAASTTRRRRNNA